VTAEPRWCTAWSERGRRPIVVRRPAAAAPHRAASPCTCRGSTVLDRPVRALAERRRAIRRRSARGPAGASSRRRRVLETGLTAIAGVAWSARRPGRHASNPWGQLARVVRERPEDVRARPWPPGPVRLEDVEPPTGAGGLEAARATTRASSAAGECHHPPTAARQWRRSAPSRAAPSSRERSIRGSA
jgi:hypothetical protein